MADAVLDNKPEAVSAAQSSQPRANGGSRLKQSVDLEAPNEDERLLYPSHERSSLRMFRLRPI